MRRLLQILFVSVFFALLALEGFCKHIKGGEIHYSYLGPGSKPNYDRYQLRLRLFISCSSTMGQLEDNAYLGIYRTSDGKLIDFVNATLSLSYLISLRAPSPCIVNPSPVCYWIREFTVIEELPKDPSGYMVVFQRCCRIDGIRNLSPNLNVGASYVCQIQGTNAIGAAGVNSNPDFGVKDTVLICQGKKFTLDYQRNRCGWRLAYLRICSGLLWRWNKQSDRFQSRSAKFLAAALLPQWLLGSSTHGEKCDN